MVKYLTYTDGTKFSFSKDSILFNRVTNYNGDEHYIMKNPSQILSKFHPENILYELNYYLSTGHKRLVIEFFMMTALLSSKDIYENDRGKFFNYLINDDGYKFKNLYNLFLTMLDKYENFYDFMLGNHWIEPEYLPQNKKLTKEFQDYLSSET